MEFMKKMLAYITSEENTLILVWEQQSGWHVASEQCGFLTCSLDGLDLMNFENYVYEQDRTTYHVFLEQLTNTMEGQAGGLSQEDNKVSVAVRLLNDALAYYNVECWLEWEQGVLVRLFVMVSELSTEEVYRIRLAQKFTSDRDPSIINNQAVELIRANPDKKYAVIQFDVVKFKMINENYGEEKGTELLNYFTSTLKVICNKSQLYSRLSADVYMIITPYETEEDIYAFIDSLDQHLLGYDGMEYKLVYGVCYVGDLTGGLRQYGDSAAMARQNMKGDALNHIAFYREEIKKNISSSKYIEDHMEKALENGEFHMYLQPKCNISNGKIVGAEALVRWVNPKKGIIPPMEFVPLFEKNGFVIKMDRYIWEEACKVIRRWMDAGVEPIPISINVSRKHLKNSSFVQTLNELVEKYQIPKRCLEVEITETVEETQVSDGIGLLKENGFTLLMDDFGSGYSSLNTLKNTQFDVIKIDREFLQDFIGSDRGQKIVEHTIKMTKSIGLGMVAEGVETEEQAAFLNECGCHVAQGFFYAKPMEVTRFEEQYIKRS